MANSDNDYNIIIDILEDILGYHKNHNDIKGQISFDCPVCSYEIRGLDHGDGKGNLEINYKLDVFKCWSCAETHDTHGSLFKLIKKYGNPRHLKKYLLLKPEDIETKKPYYKKIRLPKEFISFNNIPKAYKLTHHYRQAFEYIKKRNISEEQIAKYNIGFCYTGDYAGRIIIPSYDENDEINYFIARSYLTKTKMKYKNPEAQKETIIFNEKHINWDDRVYLVEGVFDSIFLPNSIPLLGKFVPQMLFDKLYKNAKDIVIVLDGDAWDDAVRLYHKINCGKLMNKVSIIKLPKEVDIADLKGELTNYPPKKID